MQRDTKTPTGNAVPRGGEKETQMCLSHPHSTSRDLERQIDENLARLRKNHRKLGDLIVRVAKNPPDDSQKVSESFDAHRYATFNLLDAIHRDCLSLMEVRAQELEEAKQRREAAAKVDAAERATVKEITGEDLSRDELEVYLIDSYREGGDYLKYLEAMKVLDDEAIARAGYPSRDEDGDEDA